jgi:hypothetical protein
MVEVFTTAKLNAHAQRGGAIGHHAVIAGTGPRGGRYTAQPVADGGRDGIRIRWTPPTGAQVRLGAVDTPARAAGLILDHQDHLLP